MHKESEEAAYTGVQCHFKSHSHLYTSRFQENLKLGEKKQNVHTCSKRKSYIFLKMYIFTTTITPTKLWLVLFIYVFDVYFYAMLNFSVKV